MDEDTKTKINKICIDLSREEGEVLPIAQIIKYAHDEGISEEDVRAELDVLIGEGLMNKLDDSAVSLNR